MKRLSSRSVLVLALLLQLSLTSAVHAQKKSVRPGINDRFRNIKKVEEWVKRFEGESREIYNQRQRIVQECRLKPGMVVADIGAGTGLFTRLFASAVGKDGKVVAVDIAQKFLDHIKTSAKKLGVNNVETVLGTDRSCKLKKASVDVVFICDTYHHFEFPQYMMTSIHQALKPGGRVIVIDFIREEGVSRKWILGHVRAGQKIVEKEIASCGFRKTREVKGLLKENYFVIFEKARKADR